MPFTFVIFHFFKLLRQDIRMAPSISLLFFENIFQTLLSKLLFLTSKCPSHECMKVDMCECVCMQTLGDTIVLWSICKATCPPPDPGHLLDGWHTQSSSPPGVWADWTHERSCQELSQTNLKHLPKQSLWPASNHRGQQLSLLDGNRGSWLSGVSCWRGESYTTSPYSHLLRSLPCWSFSQPTC